MGVQRRRDQGSRSRSGTLIRPAAHAWSTRGRGGNYTSCFLPSTPFPPSTYPLSYLQRREMKRVKKITLTPTPCSDDHKHVLRDTNYPRLTESSECACRQSGARRGRGGFREKKCPNRPLQLPKGIRRKKKTSGKTYFRQM